MCDMLRASDFGQSTVEMLQVDEPMLGINQMTCSTVMPLSDCTMPNISMPKFDQATLRTLLPMKKIRNVRKSDKYHCLCKTFFRRTILANRKFVCNKGGNCQFTKDFRCACRACRMDKCIRVGMNRSMIQYPSASNNKTTSIRDEDSEDSHDGEENPPYWEKSTSSSASGNNDNSPPEMHMEVENEEPCSTVALYRQPERLTEQACTLIIDQLAYREEGMHRTRTTMMPPLFLKYKLRELLQQPCLIGRLNVEMSDEMKNLYPSDPFRFWMAGDLYLQLHQLSHVCGILQTATQAYYSFFDRRADSLTFPDGFNALIKKLEQMRAFECGRTDTERFFREQYCRPIAILKDMQVTPREFAILKAIALFSPTEFDVSDEGRQLMETQRNLLLRVLHKHCQIHYGSVKGADKMSKLLLVICLFKSLAEKRREHLLICEATKIFSVTGIAREIYLQCYQ
ncbi:hypothetical protein WR25_00618 [Diploscapter pachys]|uniref:NR LBD domain-containing protein n=1 Tax=Diploscapter pachys TaxID=2018661 RepID=A0A2A2LG72_9BILA|nr:hypothetical protein WR25_00618 [Diploscapter pachys]